MKHIFPNKAFFLNKLIYNYLYLVPHGLLNIFPFLPPEFLRLLSLLGGAGRSGFTSFTSLEIQVSAPCVLRYTFEVKWVSSESFLWSHKDQSTSPSKQSGRSATTGEQSDFKAAAGSTAGSRLGFTLQDEREAHRALPSDGVLSDSVCVCV